MKTIEQIKKELFKFGKKYKACEPGLKAIKGSNLTELFQNIGKYIYWCKETSIKRFTFTFCSKLTSIIIPESVIIKYIKTNQKCLKLTKLNVN